MKVALNAKFAVADSVHSRRFDEMVVVVDLSGGQYFGLDEIGAVVWDGLVEGRSPEEIAASLLSAYEVDESGAREDVMRFVQELADAGLVVVRAKDEV
jgi:hypothetical protein